MNCESELRRRVHAFVDRWTKAHPEAGIVMGTVFDGQPRIDGIIISIHQKDGVREKALLSEPMSKAELATDGLPHDLEATIVKFLENLANHPTVKN